MAMHEFERRVPSIESQNGTIFQILVPRNIIKLMSNELARFLIGCPFPIEMETTNLMEVYVKCSVETCAQRDQ